MAAVSQTLIEFANAYRPQAGPGVEVILNPRYQATIQPDFPIPGPNSVSWIRCSEGETEEVVEQARRHFAARRLPVMWVIDPGTEPVDFAEHLAAYGIHPDPHGVESAVMVLPIDAELKMPLVPGLEIHDALADIAAYGAADEVAADAFGVPSEDLDRLTSGRERRWMNACAAGNRSVLLATVGGTPAGSGSVALYPPHGAMINGGAVRASFRGRGVYRALVAARLDIARRAGAAGLAVWGGDMSRPILEAIGFQAVGWRRFYVDSSTVAG